MVHFEVPLKLGRMTQKRKTHVRRKSVKTVIDTLMFEGSDWKKGFHDEILQYLSFSPFCHLSIALFVIWIKSPAPLNTIFCWISENSLSPLLHYPRIPKIPFSLYYIPFSPLDYLQRKKIKNTFILCFCFSFFVQFLLNRYNFKIS